MGGGEGGEAAFREEVFDEEGESLLGYGLGIEVGGELDLSEALPIATPRPRPLDHVDVIGAVSDGNYFLPPHTEGTGQVPSAMPLLPSGWPISQR